MIGRLFRTSTFRLALISVSLFAALGMSVLAFVNFSTLALLDNQINTAIETEIAGLADIYKRRGAIGMVSAINERVNGYQGRRHLYMVVDERGVPLVGNMAAWPDQPADSDGWITFDVTANAEGQTVRLPARARGFSMEGGLRLMVGRDMSEVVSFKGVIETSMLWAIGLTVVLGALGGLLMSRNAVRRIDQINRTVRTIFKGDLSQRVPITGAGDEYDQLSENLNAMLGRIDKLVRAMREVTDNIAHDLRSPLNRLRSRLEVTLLSETPGREDYRTTLEGAIADTDSILSTFNALLSIARIEGESSRANFVQVDLDRLMDDVCEMYQPVAEDKGQSLVWQVIEGTEPGGARPRVMGEPPLIGQALANMLDNAIKHGPQGTRIAVSVRAEGSAVRLSVADSGPGIPPEARDNVLERFVRLEASRHTPGTGLGLSLVAAVAERHGAQLELDDNRPGLVITLAFPSVPAFLAETAPAGAGRLRRWWRSLGAESVGEEEGTPKKPRRAGREGAPGPG